MQDFYVCLGEYVSLFVVIFFEHVPLCVCVCFDCCFFIELLRDFVCPCVYTVREKV